MKKILIGTSGFAADAANYYGKEQIAYYVGNSSEKDSRINGIPVISMTDLQHLDLSSYEIVLCVANYWEVAENLERVGVKYKFFEGICATWPNVSENISHDRWVNYLVEQFDRPDVEILEIGSRKVTEGNVRGAFKKAGYTGLDIYPGEGVDIVGDAHCLSSYFEQGKKFDLILSSAVFEHLAMPWKVAEEISKLLKVGGYFFVETHFSYSYHEKPWMFFQFSDMALRVLFNKGLGFEVLEAGCSNPIQAKFASAACGELKGVTVDNLWCHSEIFGRKTAEPQTFSWDQMDIAELVDNTSYPIRRNAYTEREKIRMVRDSMQELWNIAKHNNVSADEKLYDEITDVLCVMADTLEELWGVIDESDRAFNESDWKLFRELVAISRERRIDLEEAVLPFVEVMLNDLGRVCDEIADGDNDFDEGDGKKS